MNTIEDVYYLMSKIHIVTDSTCDLSQEELDQLGVHVVPLTIQIDGKTYIDRVDIQPEAFIDLMENSKDLPKSSQPAPGVFKELYDQLGANGDKVVSIHMTGGMSGTVQSARQAADMTDTEVAVVDSRYIAWGLGFQVREACRMRDTGATVEQIVERCDQVRKGTRLFVTFDKLDNMIKGGRIGKAKGMIGSFLNIKPVFDLDTGEVSAQPKKFRKHQQITNFLFGEYQKDTAGKTVKMVGMSHANGLKTHVEPLMKLINDTGFTNIDIAFTSPIISTHTGAPALGFIYFAE